MEGYWGTPTGTIDWCEKNYVVSPYIAEFWNTITNVNHIALGLFGYFVCLQMKLEKRFQLAYLSLVVIGVGSWMFHMTLLYEYQLMDEIPMFYELLIFVFILIEWGPERKYDFLLTAIPIFGFLFSALYIWIKIPIFFQASWVFIIGYIVYKTIFLFLRSGRTGRMLCYLMSTCLVIAAAGWLTDQFFCDKVELFKLHAALWHILTPYGGYVWITTIAYFRYTQVVKRGRGAEIRWFGPWPYIHILQFLQ